MPLSKHEQDATCFSFLLVSSALSADTDRMLPAFLISQSFFLFCYLLVILIFLWQEASCMYKK
jgi:hypothetical protein